MIDVKNTNIIKYKNTHKTFEAISKEMIDDWRQEIILSVENNSYVSSSNINNTFMSELPYDSQRINVDTELSAYLTDLLICVIAQFGVLKDKIVRLDEIHYVDLKVYARSGYKGRPMIAFAASVQTIVNSGSITPGFLDWLRSKGLDYGDSGIWLPRMHILLDDPEERKNCREDIQDIFLFLNDMILKDDLLQRLRFIVLIEY
jgi:hypothetical protein